MLKDKEKLTINQAIIVEGRDDVDAVSRACDALIIPTHGYGISAETWAVITKAYEEKGLIIFTDPDPAGERIRKRLTERFADSIQCYLDKRDAMDGDDIGIENACPEAIAEALGKALANHDRTADSGKPVKPVTPQDLVNLGLAGGEGSAGLRADVCRSLGIGYCNARAMITKLKGFRIGKDELEETVIRIKEKQNLQD